ncbi:MAG: MipA/OmpV family protein [Colwellia sp.]
MIIKIINRLILKQSIYCLLIVFSFTFICHAAQESVNASTNLNNPIIKDNFEWDFIIDLSLTSQPVVLAYIEEINTWDYFLQGLLIDISYKGFFLQTNSRRSSTVLTGSEFGYQLTVQKDWQLDLLLKAYIPGYKPTAIIKDQEKDIPQLSGLEDRNPIGGLALRYSHYFENAIFYIDFAAANAGEDEQGNNIHGIIIDSFYSYLIPYRNWDVYLGVGLTYYDEALIDYTFGINEDEATPSRPFYQADSTYRAQLEVFAQYPLSQSWSFNTGITQTFYSNNIKQSPLVDKNKLTQFMLGVAYVF